MTLLTLVNPLASGPAAARPGQPQDNATAELAAAGAILAFPGLLGELDALALPVAAGSGDLAADGAALQAAAVEAGAEVEGEDKPATQFDGNLPLTGAMMQPLRLAGFDMPASGRAGGEGDPGAGLRGGQVGLAPAGAGGMAGIAPSGTLAMAVGNGERAGAIAAASSATEPSPQARSLAASSLADETIALAAESAADRPATELAIDGATATATRTLRSPNGEGLTVATLKLPAGNPEAWRPTLLEALGERLQVAVGKQGEQAVIRLDPPMMGSIEVIVRHQAGSLQVQINATHSEVVRQLQSIGDSLRQDLVHGQYTDVSVHVQADARNGGKQPEKQDEAAPGQALAEADEGLADQSFALENA